VEISVEEDITKAEIVEDSSQAKLEKFLRESNIKVFTKKDFDFPKDEKTQAKIRAEVDEFLQMLEEDRKLSLERDESWQ